MDYAAGLDRLAQRVFDGEVGRHRVAPLLERFTREVGPLRDDDPRAELWQAVRLDWALCDAVLPPEPDSLEVHTWVRRVAFGRMPEIEPEPVDVALVGSISGLFEVWGGRQVWLREPLRGICVELIDTGLELSGTAKGEIAALWDARVVIRDDGLARLCRPPLPYPMEIHEMFETLRSQRWTQLEPLRFHQQLRRLWLHHARAPRADARAVFGAALPGLKPRKRKVPRGR